MEVAFADGALDTPSVWTDISSYVRSISLKRGRDHELSRSVAGTCTIRLRNTDRRFDPGYVSGPYYGDLKPMRQVRVTATHSAVTYPLFYGYVENWAQTWPTRLLNGAGDAECILELADGFKVLGLFEVAGTGDYRTEILADSPTEYWPLEEDAGATSAEDITSSGDDLTANASQVTFGSTPSPLFGPNGVADFGAVGNTPLVKTASTQWDPLGPLQGPRDMSIELWINPDAYPSAGNVAGLVSINRGTTAAGHGQLYLEDDGALTLDFEANGVTYTRSSPAGFVTVGEWTHVVVTRSRAGIIIWYKDDLVAADEVDSDDVGASIAQGTTNGGTSNVTITVGANSGESSPYFDGKIAHVALYQQVLSPERVLAHFTARLQEGVDDYAGTQIATTLSAIGWPAALEDLDVGDFLMQPLELSGTALETLLHIGEVSEQGLVQMTADGKVLFHAHSTMLNHTTATVTFGDGGGSEIPYDGLTFRNDDEDVYTRIRMSRNGGADLIVDNLDAQSDYGVRTLSLTNLALASDDDVAALAQELRTRYAGPLQRPFSVHFVASTTDATWVALLGLDTHHDKVNVARRPPGGGTITQGAHVEGLEHEIVPGELWEVALHLVPAFEELFFIIGTADLDSTEVLA